MLAARCGAVRATGQGARLLLASTLANLVFFSMYVSVTAVFLLTLHVLLYDSIIQTVSKAVLAFRFWTVFHRPCNNADRFFFCVFFAFICHPTIVHCMTRAFGCGVFACVDLSFEGAISSIGRASRHTTLTEVDNK